MARKYARKQSRTHKQSAHGYNSQTNLVDINDARKKMFTRQRKQNVFIIPRNLKQEEYLEILDDNKYKIVIAAGSAGTGKTLIAVTKAIQALQQGDIKKIVITRPAVSTDEDHGFLPGTLEDKMAPWVRPIYDVFEEYFSPAEIKMMIEEGIIEIAPLAYMRGRTFKDSYIILDEGQLTTNNQMKMALTRVGEGSRIIVTGDVNQTDRDKTGLKTVIELFNKNNPSGMAIVQFSREHVERSEATVIALNLFGDEE